MYPYADRIAPDDRWAIVAYIRALQLSQHAPATSLDAHDRARLDGHCAMSAAHRRETRSLDFAYSLALWHCWRALARALRRAPGLLSYLFAFVFFTGLSIGSLALAMVPPLTGGEWGRIARPQLQAAIRMLPLQALFSLPLLIGVRVIYPWADPLVLAQDAQLRAQSWYLDPTFFIVRSVIYFGVWFSLGASFGRRAGHPRTIEPDRGARIDCLRHHGDIGFHRLDHVAVSALAFDHLRPVGGGGMGSRVGGPGDHRCPVRDAAQREDTARTHGLGQSAAGAGTRLGLPGFHAIFDGLDRRPSGRDQLVHPAHPDQLAILGMASHRLPLCGAVFHPAFAPRQAESPIFAARRLVLLFASLADALWLVIPGFRPEGLALRWTDLFAPVGMGALWGCFYLRPTSRAGPCLNHRHSCAATNRR